MTPDRGAAALFATLSTKGDEARFLAERLEERGTPCRIFDASIPAGGSRLTGEEKVAAMEAAASRAALDALAAEKEQPFAVAIGIGGGTGTQICASALDRLPSGLPKLLVTTMAQDPRMFAAEAGIVLFPTVVDLSGLNQFVRRVLSRAASVAAAMAEPFGAEPPAEGARAIGITGLGVTAAGVGHLNRRLQRYGHETVAFHANGYGGNAFAAMAASGTLQAAADLTTHELAALALGKETVARRDRIASYSGIPSVILPGGLNFLTVERGRGADPGSTRPSYPHSPAFLHQGLTAGEMAEIGRFLGTEVSGFSAPCAVIVPMGGFSSEDRPGGELEFPEGREAFRESLRAAVGGKCEVRAVESHINDSATGTAAADALIDLLDAD